MSSNKANRSKAVFNWSGGKDSSLALYKVMQEEHYEVVALLTTVNRKTLRSSMHGIPLSLLEEQARSIGIPLHTVLLEPEGEMNGYEKAMEKAVLHFKAQGVTHFIFGDIFLYDVRQYREKQLAPYQITVVEPLWDKSSEEIMEEFLSSGLQTVIVTTTADRLNASFIGKTINRELISRFPKEIDICGENGEYHTFCYDGKIFRHPISYSLGKPIQRSYPIRLDDGSEQIFTYWFADLSSPVKKHSS